jgi:O-antigen/teichoic acid export membrane protein
MNALVNRLRAHKLYLYNLVGTFASQGVTALSLLIVTRLLVTRLGETSFSTYGVLLNLILIATVVDFGLNTGLSHRLIQDPSSKSGLINAVFFYSPLVFLVAFPLFLLLFQFEWVRIDGPFIFIAFLLALIVAQNMLALLWESLLQSVNKIYLSKWVRVGRTIAEAFLLIWVSKFGKVEWLLLTSALVNCVFLFFLFLQAKREIGFTISWKVFKLRLLWNQLGYSFWYFQSMVAAVIAYNIQIIVLSHYLTVTQLTIFLLVFRFFEVIRTGMTNFTQVLFPFISKLQAQGDWSVLAIRFKRIFIRVFIFSLFIFLGLLWKGHFLFSWWSQYDTPESKSLFNVYAFYVFLLVIDYVSVVFLLALKLNKLPALVSTTQSFLSLIATVFFIQFWGLAGAVWASLALFASTSLIFNPLYLISQLRKHQVSV